MPPHFGILIVSLLACGIKDSKDETELRKVERKIYDAQNHVTIFSD